MLCAGSTHMCGKKERNIKMSNIFGVGNLPCILPPIEDQTSFFSFEFLLVKNLSNIHGFLS